MESQPGKGGETRRDNAGGGFPCDRGLCGLMVLSQNERAVTAIVRVRVDGEGGTPREAPESFVVVVSREGHR